MPTPEITRIDLPDGTRTYEIPELDGKKFPSVTTITGQVDKSRSLTPWASRITAQFLKEKFLKVKTDKELLAIMENNRIWQDARKYADMIKKREGDKGTRVHEFAAKVFRILKEGKGDIDVDVDPDIEKPCMALMEWIEGNDVIPVALESKVWSENFRGYAGTLDAALLVNGRLGIWDFKTGKGVYDEHKLQVAAYFSAFRDMFQDLNVEEMGILRLDKETGFPDPHRYSPDEAEDYLAEFGLYCMIWHTKKDRELRERTARAEAKKKLPKIPRKLPKEDPF